LRIVVAPFSPGTPVAAEILNAETGDVREAVVVSGCTYETELTSGTHIVRLTPPGTGRVTGTATVPESDPPVQTMTFTLTGPNGPVGEDATVHEVGRPEHFFRIRRLLGRRGAARKPTPTMQALRIAQSMAGPSLFVCDADGTLLDPVALAGEHVVRRTDEDGPPAYLCLAQGAGPCRFVALPTHTDGWVRPTPDGHPSGTVTVRPTDPDARALLDYQAQGRLDALAAVTDHVVQRVRARIEQGRGDAAAGCAVAYHLMSHPDRGRAPQWIRMLAAAFPSSADVAVLTAWTLLDHVDGTEAEDPRERLIAAADGRRGLPVYQQGLRLLRSALRRLDRADRSSGQWDPLLAAAARSVDLYLEAADPASPFTSFTGAGPLVPLPEASPGDPEGRERSLALGRALSEFGTVEGTPSRTLVHAPLIVSWNGTRHVLSVEDESAPDRSRWAPLPVALVGTDDDRIEVTRISEAGRAHFTGDTGHFRLLEAAEAESGVLVPHAKQRHVAGSGRERSRHVLTDTLEFVVEPVRNRDRWRVTARHRDPRTAAGWALLGQRSADDQPYRTYALPLPPQGEGPSGEPALLLGRASEALDWYVIPEPAAELPAAGRHEILARTYSCAADAWTEKAIETAVSSSRRDR
jgi:hypothetical protein